ncbi:YARHG domain-containing protein [Bacillus sp. EB600]|uniref:YARHG domain-containing protein n=1 Tax=Bacillus sp. EB600 TaxID=2806345 RepID=UPI00210EB08D|nr:YARHG domain-containing protein [Bacillus sp. EB600]MCQ6282894.1 YARHG domain-containing protein [Bacillus sp. EB600]
MDFCTNCGEKLNESSRFCTNCGSKVAKAKKNITSAPKTRIEKRKVRSKTIVLRNKRLVVGVGSIIGLLFVLCVAYLIIKDFNKHVPKTDVAATKMMDQSKNNNLENNVNLNGNNSTKKNSSDRNLSSSDYILPDSDKRVLSEEDIAILTKGQLRLARNEIYARHGYVFKSADLQKYFSSKSWYNADPSYNSSLNEVEKENVKLLMARGERL